MAGATTTATTETAIVDDSDWISSIWGYSEPESEEERFPDEKEDLRQSRTRKEAQRLHHRGHVIAGPSCITRQGHLEPENDEFGLKCDNVAFSMNKGKRWQLEKEAKERLFLSEHNSDATTSLAKVIVPSASTAPTSAHSDVWSSRFVRDGRGGVESYITVVNGEMEERRGKSKRATLKELQRNPETLAANNGKAAAEQCDVHYTITKFVDGKAKDHERSWRNRQRRNPAVKSVGRRRSRDADEYQDMLEAELDAKYEEMFDEEDDSIVPPLPTKRAQRTLTVKPPLKVCEAVPEPVEVASAAPPRKLNKLERRALREAEENLMKERSDRIQPIERLSNISVDSEKLAKFMNETRVGYLPIHPSCFIVHASQSEQVFVTPTAMCVLLKKDGEGYTCHPAPSFCCQPVVESINEGWRTVCATDLDKLETVHEPPFPDTADEPEWCIVDDVSETSSSCTAHSCRLLCGHRYAEEELFAHVKDQLMKERVPVVCPEIRCRQRITFTQACALLDRGGQFFYRDLLYAKMLASTSGIKCYKCKSTLVQTGVKPRSVRHTAVCACGGRTCVECNRREHFPLSCDMYTQLKECLRGFHYSTTELTEPQVDEFFITRCRYQYLSNCYYCGKRTTHIVCGTYCICSDPACTRYSPNSSCQFMRIPTTVIQIFRSVVAISQPSAERIRRDARKWDIMRADSMDKIFYAAASSLVLIYFSRHAVQGNVCARPRRSEERKEAEDRLETAFYKVFDNDEEVLDESVRDLDEALKGWRAVVAYTM